MHRSISIAALIFIAVASSARCITPPQPKAVGVVHDVAFTGHFVMLFQIDVKPIPVYMKRPVYPSKFRATGIEGTALTKFIVDTSGLPTQVQFVNATDEAFGLAAVEAVQQWRFSPGRKDGTPVTCLNEVSINFSADPTANETHRMYSTDFTAAENCLSEQGNWECGGAVGLDWTDVATTSGHAFGLESGDKGYDDATALVTGDWGPNQMAQATVHTTRQDDSIYEEVELRLRSTLSAHKATGYEILFRCAKTNKAYSDIVRWDGPLGKFTYLSHKEGAEFGVANGDVIKATMIGDVITVYKNGVQIAQASDNVFASGRPGIGFFLEKGSRVNRDYGLTHFMAADGL